MNKGNLSPPGEQRSGSERLESWKEIATYLKRGVRTVQRWEKEEGLPVYRHVHDKLGTIYAYKPEIDAWWNNRRPQLEAEESREGERSGALSRRWRILALSAVVLALLAGGLALWRTRQPDLPFAERDWVLIATFENRTGEAVFDGTLEYALERELSNSRFVNVVPRERINDTLQLMRKPLDTRVDAAVGREVALRDGGIRGLLTGRVEKLDTTYVLSAAIVNPANGVTVTSFSEEAIGQREVVPAVRRLSSHVRAVLGEELAQIRESEQKLERVTTPSLRALQLYSNGMALVNESNWEQAAERLEQAVGEDPDFASAHILLAHCYSNVGKVEKAAPHYERAFALASSTTERERYFILGSYYARFLGDDQSAAQAYESLVSLYPDHYWGLNNLAGTYSGLGRSPEELIPQFVRLAELRPHDFKANVRAARALLATRETRAEAKRYWQRARELAKPKPPGALPLDASFMELFLANENWYQGDLRESLAQVKGVAKTLPSRRGSERDQFTFDVGTAYAGLGQFKAAEECFQGLADPLLRHWLSAWLALAREDKAALRMHVEQMRRLNDSAAGSLDAILFARAGFFAEAEKVVSRLENKANSEHRYLKLTRGELLIARGQAAEGAALLQEGIPAAGMTRFPGFFLASESLASLLEQQGELGQALRVLEDASQRRPGLMGAVWWIRVQWRLAQLYKKLGREQAAQDIEDELSKLLLYADPDHPILHELKRSQERAGAQAAR